MDKTNLRIPNHIAIIPDGNRRWAQEKGLPKLLGHKKGAENFGRLLKKARELGVKTFTSWIFSTENWKREEEEVSYLFNIARDFIKEQEEKFLKEETRFVHLGRKDRLPKDIVEALKDLEEKTKDFTEFTFALGMDYGGHDELIRTFKKLKEQNLDITEENIEKYLDTKDLPPVDLIMRTSGEKRLSGFMSWQSAYAEFFFFDKHFPDLDESDIETAIESFSNRDRRFGGDSTTKSST